MKTLEAYLADDIHRDRIEIAALESALIDTAKTVAVAFNGSHWPYEARRDEEPQNQTLSQSTTTMMLSAVDLLLEPKPPAQQRPHFPYRGLGKGLRTSLKQASTKARASLIADIKANSVEGEFRTKSGTFGWDDPLTLSFLAELIPGAEWESLRDLVQRRSKELLKLLEAGHADAFFDYEGFPASEQNRPLANAFIPLRFVRAAKAVDHTVPETSPAYLRYFESTLHDQLSFASIPDSRFDPAELAFCLEGMLLCARQVVDRGLFDRVLDVLGAAQERSAHWRPTKPFLRTERGLVLLPVSVEVANSLLRSCELIDRDDRFHGHTEREVELFRRFWNWLSARQMNFPWYDNKRISGWHSEHVADPNSIQLWDTAQVVEFLVRYRHRLNLHVARTTLRLSRFDVRRPSVQKRPWSAGTRELEGRRRGEKAGTITEQFEPVTTFGPRFKVYERIGYEFIEGWLSGNPKSFSMLLYGPPGTGKTTVAKNISDTLGLPLITISVSDFLAEGGGAVEARAKVIFEVLEAQSDCVILFDEIDELVLDRSSARHREQETVFKFMTPGMLTKLNDLRSLRRLIFILATNYAYRIDPAIRRTGRVDQSYLLLPPDQTARGNIIRQLLEKGVTDSLSDLHPSKVGPKELAHLSSKSIFLGYSDIEAAVARTLQGVSPTRGELASRLAQWARTTSLDFYRRAFSEVDDPQPVKSEFLPLAHLAASEGEPGWIPAPLNGPDGVVFSVRESVIEAARQFVAEHDSSEGDAE